jgi:DNA-binding response OmpR family regulator
MLVEDEPALADTLCRGLSEEGFAAFCAARQKLRKRNSARQLAT